jgi:hypothetical protein
VSPSSGDSGLADPQVVAALDAHRQHPTPRTRAEALALLATARVFAAVTARSTAEHVDPGTGLRAESTAEMALVTLAGSSGRGVPVFLDVPSLTAFAEGARPVRLTVREACTAALDDGAVALVVDPPGVGLVVTGDELAELAAGRVPVPGSTLSTRTAQAELTTPAAPDPALVRTLQRALRRERVDARLLDGPDGPVLGIAQPLRPEELAALAARLAPQLDRPLDLAVVPADGAGYRLRRRGLWGR